MLPQPRVFQFTTYVPNLTNHWRKPQTLPENLSGRISGYVLTLWNIFLSVFFLHGGKLFVGVVRWKWQRGRLFVTRLSPMKTTLSSMCFQWIWIYLTAVNKILWHVHADLCVFGFAPCLNAVGHSVSYLLILWFRAKSECKVVVGVAKFIVTRP